jgi:hypothetical protein
MHAALFSQHSFGRVLLDYISIFLLLVAIVPSLDSRSLLSSPAWAAGKWGTDVLA